MYLSNSPTMWNKVSFFKHGTAGLNSEFSFYLTGFLTSLVYPTIYPQLKRKLMDSCCFLRALTWSEILTFLFKISTWVADSIFYDDNHYAKSISQFTQIKTMVVWMWKMCARPKAAVDIKQACLMSKQLISLRHEKQRMNNMIQENWQIKQRDIALRSDFIQQRMQHITKILN